MKLNFIAIKSFYIGNFVFSCAKFSLFQFLPGKLALDLETAMFWERPELGDRTKKDPRTSCKQIEKIHGQQVTNQSSTIKFNRALKSGARVSLGASPSLHSDFSTIRNESTPRGVTSKRKRQFTSSHYTSI